MARTLKHGDTRSDGYRFRGYKKDGGEHWANPASWRRYRIRQTVANAKARSKEFNVPFDIDSDYLEEIFPEDGCCPALGVAMVIGGHGDNSANLDRIVPSKGYVRGNVCWLSQKANLIKTNATTDEIIRVANYLKDYSCLPSNQRT